MTPRWINSSDKHEVSRGEQIYAMLHANYQATIPNEGMDGGEVQVFIGPPHGQTEREIEILVNVFSDGRDAIIFHAMHLGPKFARYREEHPQ